jgi:hypothetical protein
LQVVDYEERHEKALAKLVVGVSALNGRFDNFLTGPHGKEHEETRRRFEKIETRLTKLEGRKRRPA